MSAPLVERDEAAEPTTPRQSTGMAAALVATGILLSRVLGLVRQSLMAKFLGARLAADAFMAAFKIPNLLQNLFGEGALSASFIPVYAQLLAKSEREEAGKVAGAVAAILALVTALIVLLGVVLAPWLIPVIAPGFKGYQRELTIQLTRILFPGAGLFVLSAWCLGVLNSHRKFFLSYTAPVLWNIAMIAALLWFGVRENQIQLASTLAWASVIGAGLQFLIQLPSVLRLVPDLHVALDWGRRTVRQVIHNFAPVFVSRGVVQISGYIDVLLASFLPVGMVALLGYAQTLYLLPVSLFGSAISAAELPEMSSVIGSQDERAAILRSRVDLGLRRIAFFVVPSAIAFLALGDVITRVLFQHGRFTRVDTLYTWAILAGSSVGLLATTLGRLYSSTYYALHDTRTPLKFAVVRVALTTALGYLAALPLPRLLGIDAHWGAAGLTASAGFSGWVEFLLLRSRLNRRIGHTGLRRSYVARLWTIGVVAGAAGFGLKLLVGAHNRYLVGALVLGVFGGLYVGLTYALGMPEARGVVGRVLRRR